MAKSNTTDIEIIPAMYNVYKGRHRLVFIEGGRGGGKTYGIGDFLLEEARCKNIRILCCREIQRSIKDSVHALLKGRAREHGFSEDFTWNKNEVIANATGAEFIYTGLLYHTVDSIKSYQDCWYCWVEEAQSASKYSLDVLTPTIRAEKKNEKGKLIDWARIFFSYNRKYETDPVHILAESYFSDVTPVN